MPFRFSGTSKHSLKENIPGQKQTVGGQPSGPNGDNRNEAYKTPEELKGHAPDAHSRQQKDLHHQAHDVDQVAPPKGPARTINKPAGGHPKGGSHAARPSNPPQNMIRPPKKKKKEVDPFIKPKKRA